MSGASPPAKLGLRERFRRRKVGNRAPSPLSSTPLPIPVLASSTAHSPGSSSTQVLSASPLSASPFTVHSPNTTAAPSSSQQLVPNSSFDLNLFEEALELLSDGDRSIIRKHTLPTAGEIDLALVQAIAAAKVKQRRCIERRWTFTFAGRAVTLEDEADKVVHWLNRFKCVGDVVVNVDPVHAGLPWAGIRFLLEVRATTHKLK